MKRRAERFIRTQLFKTQYVWMLALFALVITATSESVVAQKKYDTGVTDAEIKIGNIMPYSGPASAYGIIGRTMSAYMKMINDNGGVNGRKINFISYDDAYSPPKTVEQARKLVESDEVFLIFAPLGTASNGAIQKYMNTMKVPQLFVATGASRWGDPEHFPWTIGWQPNYRAEARIYATYILEHHSNAKIGVLFQNDDFGKDYVLGLKDVLRDKYGKMVVSEISYETSVPTVDSPGRGHQDRQSGHLHEYRHAEICRPSDQESCRTRLASDPHHDQRVGVGGRSVKARRTGKLQGHFERRLPDGRYRPSMGEPSRNAKIPRLHGEVLSRSRPLRERAAHGL